LKGLPAKGTRHIFFGMVSTTAQIDEQKAVHNNNFKSISELGMIECASDPERLGGHLCGFEDEATLQRRSDSLKDLENASYKRSLLFQSSTSENHNNISQNIKGDETPGQHLEQQHHKVLSPNPIEVVDEASDEGCRKPNSSDSLKSQVGSEAAEPMANSKRVSMEAAPYDFNDPMFSTDEFRVWEMKIRNCPKSRPHDWTMCPFAHPGEKAKRRDPRLYKYCGTACAEYRKTGSCARGDSCMYAHGVFECWLHPSRYRTQLCTDGTGCTRRVCFFAHRECELRKPVGGIMPSIPVPGVNGSLDGLGELNVGASTPADGGSLSSAIQMLDPISKHRLLEALQNDLQASASSSSFFCSSDTQIQMNSSQQMSEAQALLETIQQLHLGSQYPPRRSVDVVQVPASHHSSGIPLYNQVMNNPTRKSVDIGALSRLARVNRFSGDFVRPVSSSPGMNGPPASMPVRNSVDLGTLYDNASPSMSQTYQNTQTYHQNVFEASELYSGQMLGGRPSLAEDPRRSLSKIIENAIPEEESEGTGSGGSSSVSTMGRTTSDGSTANGSQSRKLFHREFSLENILAELPRSASQVDLVQHD
jgi:hypothetical protein